MSVQGHPTIEFGARGFPLTPPATRWPSGSSWTPTGGETTYKGLDAGNQFCNSIHPFRAQDLFIRNFLAKCESSQSKQIDLRVVLGVVLSRLCQQIGTPPTSRHTLFANEFVAMTTGAGCLVRLSVFSVFELRIIGERVPISRWQDRTPLLRRAST